jgi:hypothetical protein
MRAKSHSWSDWASAAEPHVIFHEMFVGDGRMTEAQIVQGTGITCRLAMYWFKSAWLAGKNS